MGIPTWRRYLPSPALAVTLKELNIICLFFDKFSFPMFPSKAALLIGFACFLRASTLLPMSLNQWVGSHALLTCDVISVSNGLHVIIRSTKTISNKKPFALQVFEAPGASLCPVKAWKNYCGHFARLPTVWPLLSMLEYH